MNISASAGPAATAAGATLTCAAATGAYTCLVDGMNSNVLQNGVVAIVAVTLAASASTAAIAVSNPLGASLAASAISMNGNTGTITVTGSQPLALTSVSCNPSSLATPGSTNCTAFLNGQVASGTTAVVGLSSNSSYLTVPATVTASSGASSATFSASAASVPNNFTAVVTATLGSSLQPANVALQAPASPVLSSLQCAPASLNSGATSTCTVSLSQAAVSTATVALASNNATLTVPASVSVPAGAATVNFSASAGSFTTSQQALVTATLGSSSQAAALSLVAGNAISYLQCAISNLGLNTSTACLVMLSQPAPQPGATIALSSNNPALTVPASVLVTAGQTAAGFTAAAGTFATTQTAVISSSLGSSSLTTSETLVAPLALASLQCSPSSLPSGNTSTCTATLNQSAPPGGAVIALSDNDPLLTILASVTVPAGATSATFTATASTVTANQSATITASLSGSSQTATLSLIAPTLVSTLACNPTSVNSGASTACTVTLSQAASTGGSTVALSSNNTALPVAASVSVPANSTSATFSATVGTIVTNQSATITASLSGSSQTTTLSLIAPTLVSTLVCKSTSLDAGASTICTITLSVPAPTGGIAVSISANGPALTVPASVNVPAGSFTGTFTATATTEPSGPESTQTVLVTATLDGASQSESFTLIICPCSVWLSTAQPLVPASINTQAVEVGLKFSSNMAGYITGVRFFKGSTNKGTHVGNLWTSTGVNLAKVTFNSETKSGWQTAYFASPVAIIANTTYVISYHAPQGHNAADNGSFTSPVDNLPLQALADGQSGSNGVYAYGASAFPATGASATNYWVDVIFNTSPAIGTAVPVSFWPPATVPHTPMVASTLAAELGLMFMPDAPGYITGVRFYKSAKNLGTHAGYLWTATGTMLAGVEFTNESASGWQQANFASPVAVDPNTVYVVSYWSPRGRYADDAGYFATSGVTNQVLYAPADGQYGPNGSSATTNAFPASSSSSGNFWVDVVFTTTIQ
ncbi:MAG: DUF4082 domain-containing protein [Bryobacteraceae bacterium]